MKRLFALLLLIIGAVVPAAAQNFALLPALQPWTLAWDDPNPSAAVLSYELFSGTNSLGVLTTNSFKLLGVTNGLSTFSAPVPALLAGTNLITLVSMDAVGQRSLPSLPLTLSVLPKPLATQNLRKP